jgi:DNA-directed RNA polymerase alpha subunit
MNTTSNILRAYCQRKLNLKETLKVLEDWKDGEIKKTLSSLILIKFEGNETVLDRSIEELELSVRGYNVVKNTGASTIRDLVQKTESSLRAGPKTLSEIRGLLQDLNPGLDIGMMVVDGKLYRQQTL